MARWHFPYSAGESGCWKQTAVLLQMIPPIRFFFFYQKRSQRRRNSIVAASFFHPLLKKRDQPKRNARRGLQLKKYVGKNGKNWWPIHFFLSIKSALVKKVIFCFSFEKYTNMNENLTFCYFFSEFIRALELESKSKSKSIILFFKYTPRPRCSC